MRGKPTLIAAMLLRQGGADAMLCGTRGNHADHLPIIRSVIGMREGVKTMAAMQMLILPGRQLFICDTHVNQNPDAEQLAEMTLLAAEKVQRFGLKPSVALLSHSSFGSSNAPSAQKMRDALAIITAKAPELEVEGEMRADSALSKTIRDTEFPDSRLTADANLLIFPSVDAANITYNALRVTSGGGITVGRLNFAAFDLPPHHRTFFHRQGVQREMVGLECNGGLERLHPGPDRAVGQVIEEIEIDRGDAAQPRFGDCVEDVDRTMPPPQTAELA